MTFSTQNTHYHYHQQQMFSDSQQQLFGSNTADTIIHDLNLLEGNLALKNNKLEEFQPDKDRERYVYVYIFSLQTLSSFRLRCYAHFWRARASKQYVL